MRNVKKYIIISITTIFLIIPLFFRVFIEYFLVRGFSITSISVLILGITILILIGIIIELYFYNSQLLELVEKHDVIEALIKKKNRGLVLIFFSVTMIMEELIFRYYACGILNSLLGLDYLWTILISSIVFSLYHIHIWFSFKNLRLLLINLIYPFLMGLYLGYVFLTYGYWSSFLGHFIIALIMHYNLYRLNKNNKFNK